MTPGGVEVLGEEDPRSNRADVTAEPDWPLMAIRFIAGTAFSAAVLFVAGS
jgi:hypothetical protein